VKSVTQFWYSCSLPLSPVTILQSCKKIPTGCCNLNCKYHCCLYQVLVRWRASSFWIWMSRFCCNYWRLISTSKFDFLLFFSVQEGPASGNKWLHQLFLWIGCTRLIQKMTSIQTLTSFSFTGCKVLEGQHLKRDTRKLGLQKITYCGLKNAFPRIWSTFQFSASPMTQRLEDGLLKGIQRMSTTLEKIL